MGFSNGTPEEVRTPNLLIRSQVLYPVELRVHYSNSEHLITRFILFCKKNLASH